MSWTLNRSIHRTYGGTTHIRDVYMVVYYLPPGLAVVQQLLIQLD